MNEDPNLAPNPALASYASSTAFVMTMTKPMIETLLMLWAGRDEPLGHHLPSNIVAQSRALGRRGLIVHHVPDGYREMTPEDRSALPLKAFYEVTKAGWLMLELLREAGLRTPTRGTQ